jgi:hypothetical protein
MKKVYIASPYTQGDKEQLVQLQIQAWHVLRDLGFYPIAPLLAHHLNLYRQRPHGEWLEYDLITISYCQVVIRIRPKVNGVEIPSSGADLETAEAKRLGLEYYEFESVEEMKNFLTKQ